MKTVKNFSLLNRNGKWYMRYKSADGKPMAKSVDKLAGGVGWEGDTPITKKKEANQICILAMEQGLHESEKKKGETCEHFLAEYWNWEGDRIRRKNKMNPNSISQHYANIMASNITNHVIPLLPKDFPLSSFTPNYMKMVYDGLADKDMARATVAKVIQAFVNPMKYAWKQGLVKEDPTRFLDSIDTSGEKRGIPTDQEFTLILKHLKNDQHTLLAVKLAASSGMRIGEIITIRKSSITIGEKSAKLLIDRAWSVVGGYKTPKGKRSRETFIPNSLAMELIELAEQKQNNDLVFWSKGGKSTPVSAKYIREKYFKALDLALCEASGATYRRISDKLKKGKSIREERNICFHSLRHMYVTHAGSLMDESLMRLAVGHTNKAMTDRYTHLDESNASALVSVAESILKE